MLYRWTEIKVWTIYFIEDASRGLFLYVVASSQGLASRMYGYRYDADGLLTLDDVTSNYQQSYL